MWNNWLKDCIEKLNFEYIYKKKTEFEYAKILSQKYEVKDSYFWLTSPTKYLNKCFTKY